MLPEVAVCLLPRQHRRGRVESHARDPVLRVTVNAIYLFLSEAN